MNTYLLESLIKENQAEYYKVLSQSDKMGSSTSFVEFIMLGIILQSLENLLKTQNRTLTIENRIELYKDIINSNEFSRKDYLKNFKEAHSEICPDNMYYPLYPLNVVEMQVQYFFRCL